MLDFTLLTTGIAWCLASLRAAYGCLAWDCLRALSPWLFVCVITLTCTSDSESSWLSRLFTVFDTEHAPLLGPKNVRPYTSHCPEDLLTDRILLPTVHVEWRQACVESEKRFEFTISQCREGSLMCGILSPTVHDGRPVCVGSEKRSVFTPSHYPEGSDGYDPLADCSRRGETGLFRDQKQVRLYTLLVALRPCVERPLADHQ